MSEEKTNVPVHKKHLLGWLDKPWKRILFAVLLITALLAAGGATYWYLNQKDKVDEKAKTETEVQKEAEITKKNEETTAASTTAAPVTTPTATTSGTAAATTPAVATPAATPAPATPATPEVAFAVTLGAGSVDSSYQWGCEKDYNFTFPVTSNKAGTITYKVLGSPSTFVPFSTYLTFTRAETKNVTIKKTYSGSSVSGYQYLKVFTPTVQNSAPVNFTYDYFCL